MHTHSKDIIATIFHLSRSVERLCNRTSHSIGCTGSQSRVLCFLLIAARDQDIYQKDIEKVFNIRPSSATSLLRELELQGFIYRETMSGDGRMKKIILTEKAKQIQKQIIVISDDIKRKLQGPLSNQELDAFLNVCNSIAERAANI